MKISSIGTLTMSVVLILALLLLNSLGNYLTPPLLVVYAIISTLGVYLLIIAKSYVGARMQETKIFTNLEAKIANLNEYMDKIENRIDKIDQMLEKV